MSIEHDNKAEMEMIAAKYVAIGMTMREYEDHTIEMTPEWKQECKEAIALMYELSGLNPPKVYIFDRLDLLAKKARKCIEAGFATDPETGATTLKSKPDSSGVESRLRAALFYGQLTAHTGAFAEYTRDVAGRPHDAEKIRGVELAIRLMGPGYLFSEAAFISPHPYKLESNGTVTW
jgi:hypothetical protein